MVCEDEQETTGKSWSRVKMKKIDIETQWLIHFTYHNNPDWECSMPDCMFCNRYDGGIDLSPQPEPEVNTKNK